MCCVHFLSKSASKTHTCMCVCVYIEYAIRIKGEEKREKFLFSAYKYTPTPLQGFRARRRMRRRSQECCIGTEDRWKRGGSFEPRMTCRNSLRALYTELHEYVYARVILVRKRASRQVVLAQICCLSYCHHWIWWTIQVIRLWIVVQSENRNQPRSVFLVLVGVGLESSIAFLSSMHVAWEYSLISVWALMVYYLETCPFM